MTPADCSLETAEPDPGASALPAMVLGSADILLTELLTLLTERQAAILAQVAICRAPMTLDDLAFALAHDRGQAGAQQPAETGAPDLTALRTDTDRLADLTLLPPGPDITMHPWDRRSGHPPS